MALLFHIMIEAFPTHRTWAAGYQLIQTVAAAIVNFRPDQMGVGIGLLFMIHAENFLMDSIRTESYRIVISTLMVDDCLPIQDMIEGCLSVRIMEVHRDHVVEVF